MQLAKTLSFVALALQTLAAPAIHRPFKTCPVSGSVQTLSISQTKPSTAVQVSGNFLGFGFETAFLNDYANQFSENLVNSVASRLGSPVIIRIGGIVLIGTSGDLVLFNPNQEEQKVCVSGDCPVGSSATYILGPSYFEGFKSFPNQHWTFQAPLGPTVNTTNVNDYVYNAWNAAGSSRVAAIAIGNEVQSYESSLQKYITDAKLVESTIVQNLSLPTNERIFEVLDLASGGGPGFNVPTAFADGIDSNHNTIFAAQHWYQSPADLTAYDSTTEQQYLMNHTAITNMYATGYGAANQYLEANDPSVSFIISESGSSLLGNGVPITYNDNFGACLWEVDFLLYTMSQGVKRVDLSGRPAAHHSLWVPDTSTNSPSLGEEQNIGPEVRAPYYGAPMIADFIGKTPGSVVEVLGEDTLTAYAMYNSTGALSKVALVNMLYWSPDLGTTRSNVTFQIPATGYSSVTVTRLQAADGASALGYDYDQQASQIITWAGETWSYNLDDGAGSIVAGVANSTTVPVCGSVANVIVPASEAVIVTF